MMRRSAPTVSAVLPTHNRAHLVGRAIESVLAQTFGDLELIVVDDGSSDTTASVVSGFSDKRIVYVPLATRLGAARARNAGMNVAQGQWVAFLDSDDVWMPTKLERQMALASKSDPGRRCVYYTQVIKDDGSRRVTRPRRGKRDDESVASYVFSANLDINTIVALLPTDLAREVAFLEGSRTHEEVDFFMRLESAGADFEFIPEPLSTYYCEPRPDRMSSSIDLVPSLDWHSSVAEYFTPKATRGFRAKIIAPRLAANGHVPKAVGLVLSALATASIRVDDALKYLADILLRDKVRTRVRAAFARMERSSRSVRESSSR